MGQRAELTLGLVGLLVMAGIGVIVWGQLSGRLTIFGDTVAPSTDPIIAPETLTAQAVQSSVSEDFTSTIGYDPAGTLDWNIDAGILALPLGKTTGSAQSLTMSDATGDLVRVRLSVQETRPPGSEIWYFLSPDGGTSWQPIFPSREAQFANPAGDWRWRVLMDRGVASTSPIVDSLMLNFISEL